jgi:glycosyltransferase involved in cell wall biosynthesis
MKITVLSTAFPLRGGIAHYVALLASALSRRHAVDIITFRRQYPSFLFPGKTQEDTAESTSAQPAPQLVDSINPFNWISVGRLLKKNAPDLLIFKYWLPFFGPCFGTIARIAKRNGRTRVLYICDNVLPHERRPFDKLFTRYAFSCADAFIVQSAAVEKDLLALKPDAAYRYAPHPVYNIFGAAMDKQEAKRQLGISDERVLLFFGYVRRYKGLHILLDAMTHVARQLSVRLLVVGEFYDDEEKYRAQIQDLGLENVVSVHSDYVPNDRVGIYFSASDAVVLPYTSATQSGIAQIAFNFDLPVIATDVGGLGEVIHDGRTGLLAPPDDAAALAEKILALYSGNTASELSKNVTKEKVKYSWENMVEKIEELAGQSPAR